MGTEAIIPATLSMGNFAKRLTRFMKFSTYGTFPMIALLVKAEISTSS